MIALGLGAWLILGALLFAGGFLAAVLGGGRRRLRVAVPALLAAAAVWALGLARHQVLDGDGLALAAVVVLGGGVLLMSAHRGEQP